MEVSCQLYGSAVLLPEKEPWFTIEQWLPLGFEIPTAQTVTWLLFRATPVITGPMNTVDI